MASRRRFLRDALALAAAPSLARAAPAPAAPGPAADFDTLWKAVEARYAYFDRGVDWRAARARWRPRAAGAQGRDALIAALDGLLAELADESVWLDAHAPGSPRPLPSATDLWAEWTGGDAVISAVRAGSVADVAGAVPGMRVAAVRGQPVEAAVRALLRGARQSDPHARNWALRRLLAGPWAGQVAIEVRAGGRVRRLEIERQDLPPAGTPPVVARRIGESRDLGYLRPKNNLAEASLVRHFDAAMLLFRDTRALILDLRETQSGGSPAVAEALLGRFAVRETPWIVRVPHGRHLSAQPADRVVPRGPFTYTAPVVVLVDAWTAGEGESLAVGLEAVAKATLVGTRMAGVRGDAHEIRLPGSGIEARFPASRIFHPDGTPREAVRPTLPVDIIAPSGGPGDPILYQALKLLEGRLPPPRAGRPA